MENTNEKTLNKITKLIAQATYIKKQMVYGADNFKTLHNVAYTKSHTAISLIDNLKGVRAVNKALKIIDKFHNTKI
tara:strand:- start:2830 stop:3057 length:228 start_codon:yes stop_codon:yes gene_type:complete